jgi:putative NADH-flavin reductase
VKLTIFGATGKTGRHLVSQALDVGHDVTAFVRDPAKLVVEHERLRLVQGDAMDAAKVSEAVVGADAVLVALGHTKNTPADMQAVASRHIVTAMKEHGVRRLVSLTGAGVRDPKDEPKVIDRAIVGVMKLISRRVLEDAKGHAAVLKGSGLDWIIVRGPMLTDGPKTGEYRVGYVGKGSGTRASRADVADFMLKQLKDDGYLRQAPMVSS